MPRGARPQLAGGLYHVFARGNNRGRIVVDDVDRVAFLREVAAAVVRCGWVCHAYCLMTNHYHLLVETPMPNLGYGMCLLNGRFSRRFNLRHGRMHHLFGVRYSCKVIERETQLLENARYIVLNPVRAGIVDHPADYPWSSFRATAGLAAPPTFLTTDWILGHFGGSDDDARAAYTTFVLEGIEAPTRI